MRDEEQSHKTSLFLLRCPSVALFVIIIIRFMKNRYSPRLLSASGKVMVLLASALLLTAGIYGVTQVMMMPQTFYEKRVLGDPTPPPLIPFRRSTINALSPTYIVYTVGTASRDDAPFARVEANRQQSFMLNQIGCCLRQATTGFDMLDLMPDDHFARDCEFAVSWVCMPSSALLFVVHQGIPLGFRPRSRDITTYVYIDWYDPTFAWRSGSLTTRPDFANYTKDLKLVRAVYY